MNSTRLSRAAASLVLDRPAKTVIPMEIVMLPTSVHVAPSVDHEPVNWFPARVTFTQAGAV